MGSGVAVESTPSPAALMAPGSPARRGLSTQTSTQNVSGRHFGREHGLPRSRAERRHPSGSSGWAGPVVWGPSLALTALCPSRARPGSLSVSSGPPSCSPGTRGRHSCRPHLGLQTVGLLLSEPRSLAAHSLVWGCGACWLRAGGGLALRRPGKMEDPGPLVGQRGGRAPKAIPAWWPCAVCPPCPEGRFHAVKGQSHL